jgi:hypothetical protein
MTNKQPYYHRAVILFTATEPLTRETAERFISIKHRSVIKSTIEIEEIDNEPGDPADLM